MNNRKKIEKKIKEEKLTIQYLFYYEDWILWTEESVFFKNKKLIETHGENILRTTTIEPNRVDEFCKSDLATWE